MPSSTYVNHVSVSPTNGIGPKQGQRKTLSLPAQRCSAKIAADFRFDGGSRTTALAYTGLMLHLSSSGLNLCPKKNGKVAYD